MIINDPLSKTAFPQLVFTFSKPLWKLFPFLRGFSHLLRIAVIACERLYGPCTTFRQPWACIRSS